MARMLFVPEGDFLFGARAEDASADSDEKPQVTLWLSAFHIGETPVTVREWRDFITSSGHAWPFWDEVRRVCHSDDCPIVCVSWFDCARYVAWLSEVTGLNYSLPTEFQWEKACRGTDGRCFPWGNDEIEGWASDEQMDLYRAMRFPVGRHRDRASPYGCLDMWENVGEWCLNWYDSDGAGGVARDPVGPPTESYKAMRGGWIVFNELAPICYERSHWDPSRRSDHFGFRVVLNA